MSTATNIVEITGGAREIRELLTQGRPVLVDHYIQGCPPCAQLAKTLPQIAFMFPNLIVAKVEYEGGSDENDAYTEDAGIDAFPHLQMYDAKGTLVCEDMGFVNKKYLINQITEHM